MIEILHDFVYQDRVKYGSMVFVYRDPMKYGSMVFVYQDPMKYGSMVYVRSCKSSTCHQQYHPLGPLFNC